MMYLSLPIQNGSRFIQLLGVFLGVVHVNSQAAIAQTTGEVTDFIVQLVVKRSQLSLHLLQVLHTQTESRGRPLLYLFYLGWYLSTLIPMKVIE